MIVSVVCLAHKCRESAGEVLNSARKNLNFVTVGCQLTAGWPFGEDKTRIVAIKCPYVFQQKKQVQMTILHKNSSF